MSHSPIDDERICDVLTAVRDAMVSQLVAGDLDEPDAAARFARRVDATLRAWLTGDDLLRAVQLLLPDEARQLAARIAAGVDLVAS